MAQAIIFAAGNSTRYGTNKLFENFDKKILIEYLIDFCEENNVSKIFIVINKNHVGAWKDGYVTELYHPIIDAINYSGFKETEVEFIWQDPDKYGPASGLFELKDKITEDYFILFGDNYLKGKINLSESHQMADAVIGSLLKSESEDNLRLGAIDLNNKLVEKPHNFKSGNYFIGFAFMKQKTIENVEKLKKSKRGEYEITDFINMAQTRRLYNVENIKWIDITYPEEYDKVLSYIKSSKN